MYRKYINIVEAANKGCPIATHYNATKLDVWFAFTIKELA